MLITPSNAKETSEWKRKKGARAILEMTDEVWREFEMFLSSFRVRKRNKNKCYGSKRPSDDFHRIFSPKATTNFFLLLFHFTSIHGLLFKCVSRQICHRQKDESWNFIIDELSLKENEFVAGRKRVESSPRVTRVIRLNLHRSHRRLVVCHSLGKEFFTLPKWNFLSSFTNQMNSFSFCLHLDSSWWWLETLTNIFTLFVSSFAVPSRLELSSTSQARNSSFSARIHMLSV